MTAQKVGAGIPHVPNGDARTEQHPGRDRRAERPRTVISLPESEIHGVQRLRQVASRRVRAEKPL